MDDERPWWRQTYGRPAWVRRLDSQPVERLWRIYAVVALVLVALVIVGLWDGTPYFAALIAPIGIFGGKSVRGWRSMRRASDHTPL